MRKFLLTILFTLVLSGGARADINKLIGCTYDIKVNNNLPRDWTINVNNKTINRSDTGRILKIESVSNDRIITERNN